MNRKHYTLEVAKEVCTFGYHIELPDDYDFEGANSLYNMDDSNFDTFEPEFPDFENKHPFPLTDLVNHVFTSKLIVSQYLADILTSFRLPKYRLIPLTIFDKGQAQPYYFLYFAQEDINFLDFKGTVFKIKNDLDELRTIQFESLDSYENFREEARRRYEEYQELKSPSGLPKIGVHKQILDFKKNNWQLQEISEICISKDNADDRDLFTLPYDRHIYISEKLVKEMNMKGITGTALSETNKIKRLPTTE